ncbi:MAG: tetratricopeptide repeat protein [Myxococcota bacterium]
MALVLTLLVSLPIGAARAQPSDDAERDKRMVEVYRQMLAEEPGQDYAFRRLLETAHAVGGLAGLVQMYEADVEKNPKSYPAWLVLGQLQATADNLDAAIMAFDKAAALAPDKAEPWTLRAALHRERRAWPEAFAAYDKAAGLMRDRQAKQDVLRAAAETAIEAGEIERAQGYFQKLIATEPGNIFLRMLEASTLARLDQPELALTRWQDVETRANGQLQHLVVIWKEQAELQTQLGRLNDAEATWRKGLDRLPPGHFERRPFLEGLIGVYRRQDRLRDLIKELEPGSASDFELLMTVARLYEELAEDESALARYREAQKKRPSDEEARTAALRILERIGKPEEILTAWSELVRAFPGEPRYELKLAEVFFQQSKQKEGQQLLERISREHPLDPGVHQTLVDLWLRYGERAARAAVENEYKILMRLEPEQDAHVVSLGSYYWSIEDKTRAMATWKKLLKLGKKPGEGHYLLAEVYAEHDLLDDALTEYKSALADDAQNERYIRAQALLLERMNRLDLALGEWQRLLEGDGRTGPILREAREHVIQLWERGERLDSEIEHLQRLFEAQPPQLAAGRFLAAALIRLGRLPEARTVLERLDSIEADDVETLNGLVQVYSRQNEPRKAIAILERLAKVSTRGAVEYLHRAADLALNIGDEALALRTARAVVELNPGDATAHARVGDLYTRMGHRAEAAEAWRQALALDPRNFPVRFKLASLYRDLGNTVREEQVLSDIVREAPDPTDILRAGRRLVQLALATGRLPELEKMLQPLLDANRSRDVQLRLMVEVYAHLVQALRYGPGVAASPGPDGVAAARAARDAALTALGERALRVLLDALEDNDVGVRNMALGVLEATHPPGATPALSRLAQENEASGQVQAISALGRTGTAGAVAILSRLVGSQQGGTRDLATWALGLAPTADATAILSERMKRGAPRERLLVAAAFGRGRHPGAVLSVIDLAKDRSTDVREAGLWALGRLAAVDGVPVLAERLLHGSPREAQLAAAGLGAIMRAHPDDASARAALVKGLWVGPDDAIWSALGAGTDAEEAVAAQYDGMANPERGQVAAPRATLFAAGELPATAGPGGVVARHRDLVAARVSEVLAADDATRLRLAQSLLAGPDLSLVPPGRFPNDREADRQATAAILAGRVEAIEGMLARGSPDVREAWLEVLLRWPDADAALVRRALATQRGQGAPSVAELEAWARFGDDAATLEALAKEALASDEPAMRLAAIEVAARARSEALLARGLADVWLDVRRAAAAGLAAIGPLAPATVDALVELTRDPDAGVAVLAVRAIGTDPSRRPLLDRLAAEGSPPVRHEARAVLSRP